MPLLEGTDGVEKMSKSKGNFIGLTEKPNDMFGKIMSISDELMWRYINLLSLKSNEQIKDMKIDVDNGKNPRDIKVDFAMEIVERFHNKFHAESSLKDFESRFKFGCMPDEIEEKTFVDEDLRLVAVLKNSGMVSSSSEAIRNIEQGGVRVDGEKIIDRNTILNRGNFVVQVGKRKFLRIKIN
jgi:tyrosyl-tRNA synthetase